MVADSNIYLCYSFANWATFMIIQYPNFILKQQSNPINLLKEEDLINKLKKELYSENNAAGISSPQIGESKNLFLVLNQKTDILGNLDIPLVKFQW